MRKTRRPRHRLACLIMVFLVLAAGSGLASVGAGARNPCLEPGNLTRNCGFDTFADHWEGDKHYQVPTDWRYYVLSGDLSFRPSEDTFWGAPSLWFLSDGVPFTAGIYQQVPVTPGVVYQADAGWAAVTQPDFERKLGLDPTGGIDPMAPSVVWGPSEWGINSWPDPDRLDQGGGTHDDCVCVGASSNDVWQRLALCRRGRFVARSKPASSNHDASSNAHGHAQTSDADACASNRDGHADSPTTHGDANRDSDAYSDRRADRDPHLDSHADMDPDADA